MVRSLEIFGNLKKVKDADPADSHHASLDAAKKQDIVVGRGCGEGGGRHADGDHRDEFSAG